MTTIFERVKNAMDTLSPAVPHALAPYEGALPDLYVVYQLLSSPPAAHADNVETARANYVQVSIYSRAGLVSLPDVDSAMTAAGFVKDSFRQLPKDLNTGHYGLAKDYMFLEFNLPTRS
jgi:hypothetical protein